jgi:5-formyltetrahydrofolate cyclo-ligase
MYPQKPELRRRLKAQLKEHTPLAPEKSAKICQAIRHDAPWKSASTVAIFAPLPGEPDLLSLCPAPGKRMLFPRISGPDLLWIEVTNPIEDLLAAPDAKIRLLEPVPGPSVALSEIDLLLIPGLAFSKSGGRLGRGGGYYDRALSAKHPSTRVMGVCFAFQLQDSIPLEPHDQLVDGLFYA